MERDMLDNVPEFVMKLRASVLRNCTVTMSDVLVHDICDLIEALREENRQIRQTCYSQATVETLMADLARVTAERDEANEFLNEAFDTGYQSCLVDNDLMSWKLAEELQRYRALGTLEELTALRMKTGQEPGKE